MKGELTAFEINTVERLATEVGPSYPDALEHAESKNLLKGPDPFAIDIIRDIGSFEGAPEVTDPGQIQVERRLINLPLRGQTNLLILRAEPGSKVAMDLLENAVRSAERFMGIPFPNDFVTLMFTKMNIDQGYSGSFGTDGSDPVFGYAHVLPTFDQHAGVTTHYSPGNERDLALVIAHEISHYYWHHYNRPWIDEGMARIMESYSENGRVGTPIARLGAPCTEYQTLLELEIDSPKRSDHRKFSCNYSLGESLFLDLRDTVGEQEFIQSVRRLHKRRITPTIESVKSAFPNSGDVTRVINQHYYGEADPESVKPPGLPTAKLDSVRLRLQLVQRIPPWNHNPPMLRSLSASQYYGPLLLLRGGSFQSPGSAPHVTLTVRHAESDWKQQRIVEIPSVENTFARGFIGPQRTPWLPGNYTATVEQDGRNLGEISWTVTP